MNRKLKGIVFIVFVLAFIYISVTPRKVYSQNTKIYIDPPSIIDEKLTINKVFCITVKVDNIPAKPGLVGLQFKITWNSSILNGVNMTEILFHSVTPPEEQDNIWKLKHTVKADYVEYAYTWMDLRRAIDGGYAPISGNHTVAKICLKVVGVGKTALKLVETKLGDPSAKPIEHQAIGSVFQNSPPPPPALIFIDPPKISNISLTPCNNFIASVNISQAVDVYNIEFKLGFNASILNIEKVEKGNFIPSTVTPNVMVDNVNGYMLFDVSLGSSLSGNGSLAIITFHVIGLGKSPLNLYDTELLDEIGQQLPHETLGGSFNNVLLTVLAVKPEKIIDPTLLPPAAFKINVTLTDVEDLYGYEFKLTFDQKLLTCLQVNVIELFNETNYTPNMQIDNIKGFIIVNVTYYPPAVPLNIYTPTPIVNIKFRVKAIGACNLTLCETKLVNSLGQPIYHEVHSGFFQSLIRDIAILNLYADPTAVFQGRETNITVTVRNDGNITETFTIKIYYNNNLITTVNVTDLPPNENTTVTITWLTKNINFGVYTIKAEVPPVPYEFNTSNNVFVDGTIKVKIPGDVNGDDHVDIFDALDASASFGSVPGSPNWNPDCDINGDEIVDIFDLIILAGNFGKSL
jgi:hypothetical protein